MEHGVTQIRKTLEFADVPAVTVRIADYEEILGGMLEDNFSLTRKEENLARANETYSKAAENFQKIGLPSRAAESFWKIARNQDLLGDYLKAAENFEKAYAEYKLSAARISQFSDFFIDYATYVKAWSEIERAKLAHSHEQYANAEKHYEIASNYLKKSKPWFHLASNFHAWSLLERAENLSRKESGKESIKAFEEAIQLFRESKQLLSGKLDARFSGQM
jgi:tetratricopeptide (TPR) repeat protein